ncbi:methyltransferase domain-containing protein [Filimonas lacunae]|nr:methyltransferase domain-containing protein [Filimonas lacunae]BAV07620.1 SAM-dependent methyltransferases [Filimonas lacunae]
MPLYLFAKQVDGVNFSTQTVWEGSIAEGNNYQYVKGKTGYQYIAEASNLSHIPKNEYDFLLSCHSLEHVANPIQAVKGWAELLKQKGKLVLVLPDKRFIFDHKRPYTTFEHLVEDYKNKVDEHDTTCFEELIALHDVSMDPGVKSLEEFTERLKDNFNNRCAHHHVFSQEVVKQMLEYCGFTVNSQHELDNFNLITIAEKN